ncbi:MAG: hypothetical protein WD049_04690 [Candidatus Paceibacterota bacterium]
MASGSEQQSERDPIRITSLRRNPDGTHEVTIKGLTKGERDDIQAALHGVCWVRSKNGRLTRSDLADPPREPYDTDMHPYWRPATEGELSNGPLMFDIKGTLPKHSSPSFLIQSLCGYGYTPDRYVKASQTLESFGFECMRSRRGRDGHYWEIWYLPGLYAARGKLREYLIEHDIPDSTADKETLRDIARFLFHHAPFGSLDITTQRLAMAEPE